MQAGDPAYQGGEFRRQIAGNTGFEPTSGPFSADSQDLWPIAEQQGSLRCFNRNVRH